MQKTKPAKSKVINVSCLAATLLGRARLDTRAMTIDGLTCMFPAYNSQEISNALGELLDKQLFAQRGATYILTPVGRDGRVGVE